MSARMLSDIMGNPTEAVTACACRISAVDGRLSARSAKKLWPRPLIGKMQAVLECRHERGRWHPVQPDSGAVTVAIGAVFNQKCAGDSLIKRRVTGSCCVCPGPPLKVAICALNAHFLWLGRSFAKLTEQ